MQLTTEQCDARKSQFLTCAGIRQSDVDFRKKQHSIFLGRKDRVEFQFFADKDGTVGFLFYSSVPRRPPDSLVGPFLRSLVQSEMDTQRPVIQSLDRVFILKGKDDLRESKTEGVCLKLKLRNISEGCLSATDLDCLRSGYLTLFDIWNNIHRLESKANEWNSIENHRSILNAYVAAGCTFPLSINALVIQPTGRSPDSCSELEPGVAESENAEMKDIPVVSYPEDVVESSNIDDPVLSWVTTVGDLFGRNPIELRSERKMRPGKYVIPAYQRKYAWEARQISQLCRDLLHAENARPNGSYHLGTLIFHRDAENDFFYVVDGQQRLTTISRILRKRIFHSRSDSRSRLLCEQQFTDKDERLIDEEIRKFVEEDRNTIRSALERCTFVCIAVTDITESFQLFSTQNGRGKPLSPVNLLKAFHFHEVGKLRDSPMALDEDKCKEIDAEWERLGNRKTPRDGRLLSQVIGEHLFRLRNWCRGVFPEIGFSNASIDEFKGLTADFTGGAKVPLQNLAVLRHRFSSEQKGKNESFEAKQLAHRAENDGMNPFVSVDQPIINGEDFFEYAISYAKAYDLLFHHGTGIEEFRSFHMEKCLQYRGSGRRGDTYARHVFESLALFCFDRFGKSGLVACMRELYCCAYFERLVKSRCYYSTCGSEFSIKAVRCMLRSMTLTDVKDRLQDLCLEVREKVRERFENDRSAQLPDGLETVKSVFEGK